MTQHTRTRRLAALAAGALATTSFAAVGVAATTAAASAADAAPATFTWAFSDYIKRPVGMGGQFAAPVVSDGASVDSTTGKVTFVDGQGRTDTKTHVTSVAYDGAAAFSDSHGGTSYTVTFSDPTVVIDAAGNGTLSADVSWTGVAVTPGSTQDVALTSFTAAEAAWTGPFALTATPDWTGEVPVGTYATDEPKEGRSWAQALVTALPTSLRGFFYASTISSDSSNAAKAPAPFDAVIPGPEVTATATTQSPTAVSFSVAGSGFTAVTNPGDAGVYVGLAPAGGLPDVSSMDAMDNFVDAKYMTPGQIADGAFTTTLNTTPGGLVTGTAYSVYTWQAHTHSNTTQDTETPVTIDWAALNPAASSVTVGGATGTTYGKSAVVTAAVPAAGTVALTGLGAAQSKTLAGGGTVSFTVPATLAAGTYSATVAYGGNPSFQASQESATFTVAKAGTTTAVKVARKPTAKKPGKATVTLKGASADSKVAVTVKGAGKTVRRTVKVNAQGKAAVALPKAAKGGTFKVTAAYAGDANHKASSGKATYKVAKPKKAKKKAKKK